VLYYPLLTTATTTMALLTMALLTMKIITVDMLYYSYTCYGLVYGYTRDGST
jgi:hypothetical protein